MDERYTKEGLPILTEDTRKAFIGELERGLFRTKSPSLILQKWFDEVESENSEIMEYIARIVRGYPQDLHLVTASFVVGLYRLLKSQANNNKIAEYWKLAK